MNKFKLWTYEESYAHLNEVLRKQRLQKILTESTVGKRFKFMIEIVTFAIINLSLQTKFFLILVINSLQFKCCCKLFLGGQENRSQIRI